MKKLNLFFLLTNFILMTQMCHKNVNTLKNQTKDGKLDNNLLGYIIKGKEQDLKDYVLLNKNIDLNETQKGQTYLNYAINSNNKEIIKLIISLGANPNIFSDSGNLLLLAIKNNKINAIDILIELGAKIDTKSSILLELISLAKRMRDANFEEQDYRTVFSIFKKQLYLEENWKDKVFICNDLFELICFIAPFETMHKELIYLINEKKLEINLIEPKDKKGLALYHAISKGALSNVKLLLTNGADIAELRKNRPIELLFTNLSCSFQKNKNINETLLNDVLNLIFLQIDVVELEDISTLKICKNILINDQTTLLKAYINFNIYINKNEILNLIVTSKLGSSCFKFLLERFKKKFFKEDIIFELAKELLISQGIPNKNLGALSLGKNFEEISEMINYFLDENEFSIENKEKMLDTLAKIVISNPSEKTLNLLEENFHNYIISTKDTTYSLIHAAAKNGNVSLLKWSLKFFDINDKDSSKKTVIESALQRGNENIAHLLIKLGAELPNKTSTLKQLAMPQIKGKKDLNNTNLLKNSGKKSSINSIKDFIAKYYTFGQETLIKNVKEGRLNIILYLLDNNIFKEINYIDENNKTALDYAVELGFEKIKEFLKKYSCLTFEELKKNEILYLKQMEKKTFKKLATEKELKKSLEILRISPKQELVSSFSEKEIFIEAVKEQNLEVITTFIKNDPSKIVKILNNAPLIEKVFKNYPQIVNFKDKEGNNLLIISIINNYFETVIKIINSNLIDIKETDLKGNSPLMVAASLNRSAIFDFLINRAPKELFNILNVEEKNVFAIASQNRNTKFLNLISKKSYFDFGTISEIAIGLIFSPNEKEKTNTLKTILNIMKEKDEDFKESEIAKLKEAKIPKEILEVLSKFSEDFKPLLQKSEFETSEFQMSNANIGFENELFENSIIENVKIYCQNSSFLDEWENFVDSSDEKIITNFKIFRALIEEIKTTKKIENISRKTKFIFKNLYEIKINRTRIFYSIKNKTLIILGIILYKDKTKSSKAIEYLKENLIKIYEKWETKKFADLEFAN